MAKYSLEFYRKIEAALLASAAHCPPKCRKRKLELAKKYRQIIKQIESNGNHE